MGLDCDLGCPSISPPTADLYIPDAIDPATAYYARLKAVLILHMAEVIPRHLKPKLGRNSSEVSWLRCLCLSVLMGCWAGLAVSVGWDGIDPTAQRQLRFDG